MSYEAEEIKRMVANRLTKEGYEGLTDDIRFSLSHCPGDGIAFYGGVAKPLTSDMFRNTGRVESLLSYLKDHMGYNNKEIEEYKIFFEVKKDMRFHLYDHYNTMIVRPDELCDFDYLLEKVALDILDSGEIGRRLEFILEDTGRIEELMEYINNPFHSPEDEVVEYLRDIVLDDDYYIGIQEELISLSKELERKAYNYLDKAS